MAKVTDQLSHDALGFDPEALTSRYLHERDKRIRKDAEAQFVAVTNDTAFANQHLSDDP